MDFRKKTVIISFLCSICLYQANSTGCPSKLDIVFIVDGSGSIQLNDWELIQDFLVQVVNRLDVGGDRVRFGMVIFSEWAWVQWDFNDREARNKRQLLNAIRTLPCPSGRTATSAGIYIARTQVFPDSREDAEKIAVVLTDGRSNLYEEYFANETVALKDISRVVAIGVTSLIDHDELTAIASTECDIFEVDYFEEMDDDMDATMDFICGCSPGYHLAQDHCGCEACPVNEYTDHWGQEECNMCPDGQGTQYAIAAMQCQEECPPGSHIRSDMSGCELCEVGTYQHEASQTTCDQCPPSYSTRGVGATSEDECQLVCGRGSYAVEHDEVMQCMECEIGTYQPGEFAESCIECLPGFSTRQQGSIHLSQCKIICDVGEQPDATNRNCTVCPIGTYQGEMFGEACTQCPAGYSTRQNGSTSMAACEVVCDVGEQADDSGRSCMSCPIGTYQDSRFGQACMQCEASYSTRKQGSINSDQCEIVCDVGQEPNEDRTSCTPCSIGSYQDETFGEGCIQCPTGYNTRQEGSSLRAHCEIVCDIGEEPNENITGCIPCPIGSYQETRFGAACRSCPPGYSTRTPGAYHVDLCEDLNPPEQSSDNKENNGGGGFGNMGAVIGGILGALLLIVLIAAIVLVALKYRRKRAYDDTEKKAVIGDIEKGKEEPVETKPENIYNIEPTEEVPDPSCPYDNGELAESPYDNGASAVNHYDNGVSSDPNYDNGAAENIYNNLDSVENPYESPYDNGANKENVYDNGASKENVYDNGVSKENVYDNGTSPENPYDNGPHVENDLGTSRENPYDNGETNGTEYDNLQKSGDNVYDNFDQDYDEPIYNSVDENPDVAEGSADTSGHVTEQKGLDNPTYNT